MGHFCLLICKDVLDTLIIGRQRKKDNIIKKTQQFFNLLNSTFICTYKNIHGG